jgi:hypothetical protein
MTKAEPPIFRLPDEVLVYVFAECGPVPALSSSSYRQHPASLSYTWVCHAWRALALDTPALWTFPLFRWPAIAAMMLQRAVGLDLPVICLYMDETPMDIIRQVLAKAHTTRDLQLIGEGDRFIPVLKTMPASMPNLESLSLEAEGHIHSAHEPLANLLVISARMPRLTDLALVNVKLALPSYTILRGVSRLTLDLSGVQDFVHPRELAAMLCACPALVVLYIHSIFTTSARVWAEQLAVLPVDEYIRMPHLQRLIVQGPYARATAFASWIAAPTTCVIELPIDEGRALLLLLRFWKRRFAAVHERAAVDEVRVGLRGAQADLTLVAAPSHTGEFAGFSRIMLRGIAAYEDAVMPCARLLGAAVDAAAARTLAVSATDEDAAAHADWEALLAQCVCVERVRAEGAAAASLFHALAQGAGDDVRLVDVVHADLGNAVRGFKDACAALVQRAQQVQVVLAGCIYRGDEGRRPIRASADLQRLGLTREHAEMVTVEFGGADRFFWQL